MPSPSPQRSHLQRSFLLCLLYVASIHSRSVFCNGNYKAKEQRTLIVQNKPIPFGLCNQLYSIIHGIITAEIAGAKHYNLTTMMFHHESNVSFQQMSWRPNPASRILDIDCLNRRWHSRKQNQMRIGTSYTGAIPVDETVDVPFNADVLGRIHEYSVPARARQIALHLEAKKNSSTVSVTWDHRKWAHVNSTALFPHAVHSLCFAEKLHEIARKAIHAMMAASGSLVYFSVHLRVEEDFRTHPYLLDAGYSELLQYCPNTTSCIKNFYSNTLRRVVPHDAALYIASGIFDEAVEAKHLVQNVLKPVTKNIFANHDLIPFEVRKSLSPEELAAVDFMICNRSQTFVGFPGSSFAALVAQARYGSGKGSTFVRAFGTPPLGDMIPLWLSNDFLLTCSQSTSGDESIDCNV